ncbi:MAG TPA: hypothetical protein VNB64_11260 [Solirubrobacteraceae bacterium]|nr:hypothetical protein [Solirubrobacteraceae bacterium]
MNAASEAAPLPTKREREAQREWERRRAPLAAATAAAAAILPMCGAIVGAQTLADQPKDSASRLLYFHEHSGELLAYAVLLSLGALALAFPMYYLYRATRFRRPQVPRAAVALLLTGCAMLAVVQIGSQVVLADRAGDFAGTDKTYEGAKAIFDLPGLQALGAGGLAAQLSLAFAFVLISLNAMRAGLLTRFMGFLGIIVGVLFVLPLAPGPPVVQSFWLLALAAVLLGRWPSGVPRAWEEVREIPWPTRQEMIEQAQREREGEPAATPEPAPAGPSPARSAPASRKRKRKKRR